jgi:hypothetical protein
MPNALMCIAFFVNNCIAFFCPLIFINTKSFKIGWKQVSSLSKLALLLNLKRGTQVSSVNANDSSANVNNTGGSYANNCTAA